MLVPNFQDELSIFLKKIVLIITLLVIREFDLWTSETVIMI